jgi:hypothetical protein
VAVIDAATKTVTGYITVGTAPRQIVLNADGSRAYVGTEGGIYVINTATNKVVGVVKAPGRAGPGPERRRRHALRHRAGRGPGAGRLHAHPARGPDLPGGRRAVVGRRHPGRQEALRRGHELELRVGARRRDRHKITTVTVGSLPTAIGVTPDGSEVWVGNDLTGSLSVISTATDTLAPTDIATIPGGPAPGTGGRRSTPRRPTSCSSRQS